MKALFNKNILKIICLIIIIGLVFFVLMFPITIQKDSEKIRYVIEDLHYYTPNTGWNSYVYTKIPVKVLNLRLYIPLLPVVPINFEKEGINLSDKNVASTYFNIKYNGSLGENVILEGYSDLESKIYEYESSPWVKDIKIQEGVIGIIYDSSKKLKKDVKEIYLYGLIKENITQDSFYYEDTSRYPCNKNQCRINVIIKYNLSLPVTIQNGPLFNLKNRGVSNTENCNLSIYGIEHNLEYDLGVNSNCNNGEMCSIDLFNKKNKTDDYKVIFDTSFQLNKEDGSLWRYNADLEVPMEVNITLDIKC